MTECSLCQGARVIRVPKRGGEDGYDDVACPRCAEESEQTPLEKARAKKVENQANRKRSLNEEVQAAIDNPLCEPELRRKLQYCLDQVKLGRSELAATRDFYLQEARRRGYVEARA